MNFIVAVDEEWNIGKDGLYQPIPDDLKQFRARTINRVVVFGRKTTFRQKTFGWQNQYYSDQTKRFHS